MAHSQLVNVCFSVDKFITFLTFQTAKNLDLSFQKNIILLVSVVKSIKIFVIAGIHIILKIIINVFSEEI